MRQDMKIVKFTMVVEDINEKISEKYNYFKRTLASKLKVGSFREYIEPLDLVFERERLNEYAKIIFEDRYLVEAAGFSKCDILENVDDPSIRLKAIKELISALRGEWMLEEAIIFIFWCLFVITIDTTDYEEKVSLVADIAYMIEIEDVILKDITHVIKLILGTDILEINIETDEVYNAFSEVIDGYIIW